MRRHTNERINRSEKMRQISLSGANALYMYKPVLQQDHLCGLSDGLRFATPLDLDWLLRAIDLTPELILSELQTCNANLSPVCNTHCSLDSLLDFLVK